MLRQGSLFYGGHLSSCITSRKLTPWSYFYKYNQFFFSWGVISLRRKMTHGHYSAGVIILLYSGISGKLLRIIRSLYTDVRACIKSTGQISEEFPVNTGLLQGEVLSPLLFTMYINDLERQFITENCPSVELKELNLFIFLCLPMIP